MYPPCYFLQELTPFLIDLDKFQMVDDIVGIGLVLHERLDGGKDDPSDPVPFLLVNLDEL